MEALHGIGIQKGQHREHNHSKESMNKVTKPKLVLGQVNGIRARRRP
uniref:Uncharacterized protein n=1 Tax=Rhizophora mucronata TaxID=61149 RepID=A0A2P2MY99_RHIMU